MTTWSPLNRFETYQIYVLCPKYVLESDSSSIKLCHNAQCQTTIDYAFHTFSTQTNPYIHSSHNSIEHSWLRRSFVKFLITESHCSCVNVSFGLIGHNRAPKTLIKSPSPPLSSKTHTTLNRRWAIHSILFSCGHPRNSLDKVIFFNLGATFNNKKEARVTMLERRGREGALYSLVYTLFHLKQKTCRFLLITVTLRNSKAV